MLPRARYLIPALGLGLAVTPLAGQGFDLVPELKLRVGNTGKKTEDHLLSHTWGFGVGVTQGLGKGRLGLEVGFFYKGGDPYMQFPVGVTVPAGKAAPDVSRAVDSRAASSSGIAVRLNYSHPINQDLKWNVGVMLGGSVARFNYDGDVASEGWHTSPNGTTTALGNSDPKLWRDTYNGARAEFFYGISPFVGVSMDVTKKSYVELNLLVYNYKAMDYVHQYGGATAYTAQMDDAYPTRRYLKALISKHNDFPGDAYTIKTRWVPHFELNYGFRF